MRPSEIKEISRGKQIFADKKSIAKGLVAINIKIIMKVDFFIIILFG